MLNQNGVRGVRFYSMFSNTVNLYRQSFSGLNTSVWFLSLINLINRAGTMVVPFMTMYITQSLHMSLTRAGFVLTCFGTDAIIGALIGGRLTDLFGHYKVQLLTLFFGGLSFILLGQLKDYSAICMMTFILALINEAFRPANMSAIGLYSTPENRTRSSSLVRLSVNLGWAVGATAGGFLAAINYQLLFWVDGLTNILAAVCLFFVLKPTGVKHRTSTDDELVAKPATQDRVFMIFVLLSFMFALSFFQIFSTYPVYLKNELHITEQHIGWIFALNGLLIALFEMIIISSLSGRGRELKFISSGLVLTGLSFVILNVPLHFAVLTGLLSCLFFTAGEILSMPFMMTFWMNRTDHSNRGQYAGYYTISYSAAHISGPFLGSLIADHWGFQILWYVVFVFCLLTFWGFRVLNKMEPSNAV